MLSGPPRAGSIDSALCQGWALKPARLADSATRSGQAKPSLRTTSGAGQQKRTTPPTPSCVLSPFNRSAGSRPAVYQAIAPRLDRALAAHAPDA